MKKILIVLGVVLMVLSNNAALANEFDAEGRIIAKYGSPIIDGQIDEVWKTAYVYTPKHVSGNLSTEASFRVLWDDNAIYVLAEVKDKQLSAQSNTPYMQDSVEIFLDENNDKSKEFGPDDVQYRVNYQNFRTVDKGDPNRFYTASRITDNGYIVEARIALKNKAENGQVMGIELQVNDAIGSNRAGTLNLFDGTGMAWDNTALFGEVILLGKDEGTEPGLNPYDLISLLQNTLNIDLSLYKNADIIQKEINKQYQDLLAVIDKLEYTEEAANEKWFLPVPAEYRLEAEIQGRIERLSYQAKRSSGITETKYLNVYLPPNYDPANKYNVFYMMHGNSENVDTVLGGPDDNKELKRIIDNMIANGDIEPLIIVTPTYYADSDGPATGAGIMPLEYYKELIEEVIPFVESRYSTYAESTDKEGLIASREHRAVGGFSRGSMTTWHVFLNSLEYFKYYVPLSAGAALIGQDNPVEIAENLASAVKTRNYTADDFYLFCANGTDDFTFEAMARQIDAMKEVDIFKYSSNPEKGNFYFMVVENAGHTWYWVNQYIYNILPDLFK
ncbi:MAG TPA: sugar-binding protein [Halanaerobiales bacterium]|nr:sugar-binding protein [Halanaerobiales bacterium]